MYLHFSWLFLVLRRAERLFHSDISHHKSGILYQTVEELISPGLPQSAEEGGIGRDITTSRTAGKDVLF